MTHDRVNVGQTLSTFHNVKGQDRKNKNKKHLMFNNLTGQCNKQKMRTWLASNCFPLKFININTVARVGSPGSLLLLKQVLRPHYTSGFYIKKFYIFFSRGFQNLPDIFYYCIKLYIFFIPSL